MLRWMSNGWVGSQLSAVSSQCGIVRTRIYRIQGFTGSVDVGGWQLAISGWRSAVRVIAISSQRSAVSEKGCRLWVVGGMAVSGLPIKKQIDITPLIKVYFQI